MRIKVKKIEPYNPAVPLPSYKTDGAAGLDLCSQHEYTIAPGDRCLVRTGIALEIPEGYEGQIRSRSGLALSHGIVVLNSPGTIDEDFRSELKVILTNLGTAPVTLPIGSRVAQLVIALYEKVELTEVEELGITVRGSGGFGSTGVKMSQTVFGNMVGCTMAEVHGAAGDDEMLFVSDNGKTFRFYHEQDCCETVTIEDVCGAVQDLVGSPLVQAEEVDGETPPQDTWESSTWTFYKFATVKGSVTVRWLGVSNGYYSEGVEFSEG